MRRAYFDMLGLAADARADRRASSPTSPPNAWKKVVEELLASPHYGERWGQHWLDVVRYAETEGFEYDRYLPGPVALPRLRDSRSVNDDKPFNEFIREQIAGDEMVEGDLRAELQSAVAGRHRIPSPRGGAPQRRQPRGRLQPQRGA